MNEFVTKSIAIAVANKIVTSVAIANGAQIIANQPDVPRNITIAVTDMDTSIDAGVVTVTGTDIKGDLLVEAFDLTTALVFVGTSNFATITSVVVSALHGAALGDTLIVGVGSNVQLTLGNTTLGSLVILDDSGTVGGFGVIDGTSGTTVNVASLKADIANNVYKFDCVLSAGLRVIMAGDTALTVTYRQ